jgi:hypothetical protein
MIQSFLPVPCNVSYQREDEQNPKSNLLSVGSLQPANALKLGIYSSHLQKMNSSKPLKSVFNRGLTRFPCSRHTSSMRAILVVTLSSHCNIAIPAGDKCEGSEKKTAVNRPRCRKQTTLVIGPCSQHNHLKLTPFDYDIHDQS